MIINYEASINLEKICSSVTFLTEITLQEHNSTSFRKFEDAINKEPTLIECYQVSGRYDYFARFVCVDADDYKAITDRLLAKAPIKSIQSNCMLSKVKRYSGYPLKYLLDKNEES